MKQYKVETKGSLFEVTFEHGAYSDWEIKHYVFTGNTAEEVWEFVKVWTKEGGLGDDFYCGLVWNDRRFQYAKQEYNEEVDWSTDYGDAYKVEIKRLNVIYVRPKKLLADFKT